MKLPEVDGEKYLSFLHFATPRFIYTFFYMNDAKVD